MMALLEVIQAVGLSGAVRCVPWLYSATTQVNMIRSCPLDLARVEQLNSIIHSQFTRVPVSRESLGKLV